MEKSLKPKTSTAWVGPSVLIVVLLALLGAMVVHWDLLWGLVTDPEKLKAWMAPFGAWAPVVYIALNFFLGVTVILPGEIPMIAGGFLFGAFWGTIWATLGTAMATVFCVLLARRLGLSFVQRIFGEKHVAEFERLISGPKALVVFFFLFLIPGLPKHILSYLGGLTKLNLWVFLAVSLVGHTPALVGAMLIGEAAAKADWSFAVSIGVLALAFLVLGLVFRKPLMTWLETLAPSEPPAGP